MMHWERLPTLSASMSVQMAFDELLLKNVIAEREKNGGNTVAPILRFYFASEKSKTVGYSHPISKDTSITHSAVPVCKRITGGGVVEHGDDFLFSLIAPKEADDSFKTVRICYWKIHEALKLALERMGKSIRFYRVDDDLPRGGECFVYPIASDLGYEGKKIAGGAQKRSMGVLLHQESVQLGECGIKDGLSFQPVLIQAFEEIFETKICEADLPLDLWFDSGKRAEEKYSNLSTMIPAKAGL